jgi:hypothetical protein
MIIVPEEDDKFVLKLLEKMTVEYLPEKVQVKIEAEAKTALSMYKIKLTEMAA